MYRHLFSALALAAVVVASAASGQVLGVSSDTTLPASGTVTSALADTPFSFSTGVTQFGTTADTTVTFTGSSSSPAFKIASGGSSASGTLRFGSCIFVVTASTFAAGSPLSVGQTVTVNPCNLNVGTAGAVANGVGQTRSVALLLGAASSAGASVTLGVNAGGQLTLNGNSVGSVTLTPIGGDTALASPTPRRTATPTPTPTSVSTATPTPSASAAATTAAPTTAAPTQTPTQAPTATPAPTPTASPTPTPSPTPTASPTPSPTPAGNWPGWLFAGNASGPVPPGFTRYGATVVDAASGAPVVDACVYTGPPAGCPTRGVNHTDATGSFAVDLPSGSAFLFNIQSDPQNAIYGAILQTPVAGTTGTMRMTHK